MVERDLVTGAPVVDAFGEIVSTELAGTSATMSVTSNPGFLQVTWSGVTYQPSDSSRMPYVFDVIATIQVDASRAHMTEWDLSVVPDSPDQFWLDEVSYPIVDLEPIDNGALTLPYNMGAISRDPVRDLGVVLDDLTDHIVLAQPGNNGSSFRNATMQCFSYYNDLTDNLLYLSTADQEG